MKYSFFIIIFLILFSANYWIFQRIYTLFSPSMILKIILIVLAIFLSTSFLISHFFESQLPFQVNSILSKIGSSWIFIILYIAIIFGIQELFILIGKTGILPDVVVKFVSRGNKLLTIIELVFVFAIFLMVTTTICIRKEFISPIKSKKTLIISNLYELFYFRICT